MNEKFRVSRSARTLFRGPLSSCWGLRETGGMAWRHENMLSGLGGVGARVHMALGPRVLVLGPWAQGSSSQGAQVTQRVTHAACPAPRR